MQTSRECVKRAIEFKGPDRIPQCMDIDLKYGNHVIAEELKGRTINDLVVVSCADPDFKPDDPSLDQWGYRWESFGSTMGEVVENPISDWEDYDRWLDGSPDFSKPARYDKAKAMRASHPDTYLAGGIGFVMMELINLRGYSNYMMDFYLERENLEKLIDRLYVSAFHAVDGYAEAGMDGIIIWEDWGLQDRLMINPELWHEIFYDRMKKFVDHIHSKGMHYILHSCGYIVDIMDDLISMGVDVIQMDQQSCMGFEKLAQWKGKICYFNPVDIQLLHDMNEQEISDYAKEMVAALATEKGGFMYKTYSQPVAIGSTAKHILAEMNAFKEIVLPEA